MPTDKLTTLRLQLLANGYSVLPSRGKVPGFGWQRAKITPDLVRSWKGSRAKRTPSTGMRIEHPIRAIDADIYDPELAAGFLEDVAAIAPEVFAAGLLRVGQPPKFSLFGQGEPGDPVFYCYHSSDWTKDGVESHAVEIFGGGQNGGRFFGLYGPHSFDEVGKVARTYEWPRASLLDVKAADLPRIGKAALFDLLRAFDARAERMGFERVPETGIGETVPSQAFDLTEETRFDDNEGGVGLTLAELEANYFVAKRDGRDYRVSSSFLGHGSNTSKCRVGWSERFKTIFVHDHKEAATHYPAAFLPFGSRLILAEAIRRAMDSPFESAPAGKLPDDNFVPELLTAPIPEPPPNGADQAIRAEACAAAAAWLRDNYALFVRGERSGAGKVVPIRAREWTPTAISVLRTMLAPYEYVEVGIRGGRHKISPVDVWLRSEGRIVVDGFRVAPDKAWPLFVGEEGRTILNLYKRPHLPESGDPGGGFDLIEALIPDEVERAWYLQWLAHKLLHPEIPQVGVVQIAQALHGTGRGLLFKLIETLIGAEYCYSPNFQELVGFTGQGQYNGYMADNLMIFVNETFTAEDNLYQGRRMSYEKIKELVDPARRSRQIVRKYIAAETVVCGPSFHFASNHSSPLSIERGDRRLTVLSNGEVLSEAFFDRIAKWLADPANVGAFRAKVEATDLAGYTPYHPIMTARKEEIEEGSPTEIEQAVEIVLGKFPGEIYALAQVVKAIGILRTASGWNLRSDWEGLVERIARHKGRRIGRRDGLNWKPTVNGERVNSGAYAVGYARWRLWLTASTKAVERHLKLNEEWLTTLRKRPGFMTLVKTPESDAERGTPDTETE